MSGNEELKIEEGRVRWGSKIIGTEVGNRKEKGEEKEGREKLSRKGKRGRVLRCGAMRLGLPLHHYVDFHLTLLTASRQTPFSLGNFPPRHSPFSPSPWNDAIATLTSKIARTICKQKVHSLT
ncbi:hypothetical protein VNO78_25022 [Psophocarpus tetragonolobus]|uniref:Uncharacterized protein n=1 Tax=Psophocarpus tetragonolobus TaxID=3891 RepID=A0AAN9S9C0_PSOTE